VNPAIKYTLARLGIFVVVLLALLPIPALDTLVKLMIAVLVSAVASWFLLRRMRDQVADRIEESMERRREQKEKLRAALAGEAGEASDLDPTDAAQEAKTSQKAEA
jgi:mannitol-specific phosphotransferase system IIBC component